MFSRAIPDDISGFLQTLPTRKISCTSREILQDRSSQIPHSLFQVLQ